MKARTLWLVIPWAVFAVLAIGWSIYWHVLAGEMETRLRAVIAEQNGRGADASIGRIVRHGFPVLMRFELQDVSYLAPGAYWSARTDRADLHVQIINPQHVIVEAQAPIAFARKNGDVTNISADALIASLRMNGATLAQAGIEADNLMLDDPAKEGVLHAAKLVLNVRPDPRAEGHYQIAFDATALILPRPVRSFEAFGLDVQALRAAIVIEQARALVNPPPGDPLEPWREADGRLRFEALSVQWGPLQATGTGWGGLDHARRLMGALALPVEHPAPVLATLANGPSVEEDARRALGLLAASFLISGDDINLDVEANEGVMRLEGFEVRELPAVY